MSIFDYFRRKKIDPEAARHERLRRNGRIAEGVIFDINSDTDGEAKAVFYSYHINGVDYESSQALTADQQQRAADYSPGTPVTIRYDPHQPANSVVV